MHEDGCLAEEIGSLTSDREREHCAQIKLEDLVVASFGVEFMHA